MRTIGCVGCGNMGSALMDGFAGKLNKSEWRLACFDIDAAKMDALKAAGCKPAKDAKELASSSDLLILAVKPSQMPALLDEIAPSLSKTAGVVSIAAGFSLQRIRLQIGLNNVLARCMPTITAAVDRGLFALSFDPVNLTDAAKEGIVSLFGALGKTIILEETRLNSFAAWMGAAPAYIFQFASGLAQAGLTLGFSQEINREMIGELLRGCAALAAKDNKTFMELRDAVCSPAGLTIAGVNVLDRAGLTGLIVDCVLAAERRGREMEEEKK
ncbi:MAG: NAD(P)-binding domain-containing protein [Desulfovibrio sp.]|nr:NAD(P)-binding domain-containing protein [Desulfovibrio sp.]